MGKVLDLTLATPLPTPCTRLAQLNEMAFITLAKQVDGGSINLPSR